VGIGFGNDVAFGFVEKEKNTLPFRFARSKPIGGNNKTLFIWKGDFISRREFVFEKLDFLIIYQNLTLFDEIHDFTAGKLLGGLEIGENVHRKQGEIKNFLLFTPLLGGEGGRRAKSRRTEEGAFRSKKTKK
jgi:hypothetical protein